MKEIKKKKHCLICREVSSYLLRDKLNSVNRREEKYRLADLLIISEACENHCKISIFFNFFVIEDDNNIEDRKIQVSQKETVKFFISISLNTICYLIQQ